MEISPAKRGQEGSQFFKAERGSSAYFPVNTLMLRKATQGQGDEFLLDGQRIELVKMTCRVPEIRDGAQRYDLTFADEFGGYKGVIYRSSKGTSRVLRLFNMQTYQPSDYVTVVGHVRKFQDNAMLMVDWITEVTYDEVMEHRAQVLWARGLRCGKSPEHPKSEVLRERAQPLENRDEFAHLQPLQGDILRTAKRLYETKNRPEGGINKAEILRELRTKPMDKEFEGCLQSLMLYGYLMDADRDCYVPAT